MEKKTETAKEYRRIRDNARNNICWRIETISNRSLGFYRKVTPKKTYPPAIKGKCWCCFAELPPRKRKWCNNDCQYQYWEDTHTEEFISWNMIRNEILERDGCICMGCKKKHNEEYLEVHHIIPVHKDESKEFDKDNLITLCKSCHNKTKKRNNTRVKESIEVSTARFFSGHRQMQFDINGNNQPLKQVT